MIRYSIACITLLTGSALGGPHVDDDAKPLLRDLLKNYQELPGCYAQYEISGWTDNRGHKKDSLKGSIEAVKPDLFHVTGGGAAEVSDGKTMWLIKDGQVEMNAEQVPTSFAQAAAKLKDRNFPALQLVFTLLSTEAEALLLEDCKHMKLGPPRFSGQLPTLVLETREGGTRPAGTMIELNLGLHGNRPWVDGMTITEPGRHDPVRVTYTHWKTSDRPAGNFRPGMKPLAEDQPGETTSATIDISPEARTLLDRVSSYYASLPGVSTTTLIVMQPMPGMFTVGSDNEISPEDPGLPVMEATEHVVIECVKPNLFRILHEGGEGGRISNGVHYWEYLAFMKAWSESPAPSSLKSAWQMGEHTAGAEYLVLDLVGGVSLAESTFLQGTASIKVQPGKHSGEKDLVIAAQQGVGFPDWKIYMGIAGGDTPWLNRILIELHDTPEAALPGDNTIEFVFKDWKISRAPASSFDWTPLAGWKKVDNLMEALEDMAPSGPGPSPPDMSDFIGRPAPAFALESLKGQEISLASLKGKVVILDFWATWCGPCRQGLPVLMEIAKDREGDGVVLWSIDLKETPGKVNAFLEKSKWNLPVLLDPKGAVAREYGVGGIPHTVIIDRDGTIQAVEIGFRSPEIARKSINEAIDKAVASKTP